MPVVALVERDGRVASRHVANITAKDVREHVVIKIDRASYLMTDESPIYVRMGKEFSGRGRVNHGIGQYVTLCGFKHTNTVENFFSIFKRGINGIYHHLSEQHLSRYCAVFDFRYNTRKVNDDVRTDIAMKGARGKRLTNRRIGEAA